ncbi:multiple PDZ domain protein [Nephila pilipes]|uniref:Multiple PDZ domain protein n=1 Tax=Nephila pilipes TaxID=299642 RepID=A0A8X6QCD9_NEPPI|nr:multiple PDZ domain protein [Nephila pilipes]
MGKCKTSYGIVTHNIVAGLKNSDFRPLCNGLLRPAMDLEELHFADDSADDPYEIILLPETSRKIAPENRLSPAHACLPLKGKALSNIQEFVETTIVLKKDKKNELGISIAGGSDSYLVNDISFREASLADAVRCLKETPSPVRLIILRENPQALFTTNETPTKFITVELRKFSIKDSIGISIMQRTNGRGVFVTYVPGSIAARHGRRISQGDQILEINGHNVRESNQKDVAHMIQNLDGAIVLLLGRVPALYSSIQEWVKWKAQQCLRTRTSTWSSYTANTKEKLQVQRPSLPVSKESPALGFANTIATVIATVMPDLSNVMKSPCHSPSSSLRRSRLSIPEDTSKFKRDGQRLVEEFRPTTSTASEKPRVPSILVTSF